MNIRQALVFLSLLLGCTKPSRDDAADSAAPPAPAQAAQPPSEPRVEGKKWRNLSPCCPATTTRPGQRASA